MKYKIKFASRIEKFLEKLRKKDLNLIFEKIEKLRESHLAEGSVKLKGKRGSNLYRIRAGNYRIIYTINQSELIIIVVAIGNRKDIYQDF